MSSMLRPQPTQYLSSRTHMFTHGDLVKPWESGMTATGLWDGKYYSNEELQWLEAGV